MGVIFSNNDHSNESHPTSNMYVLQCDCHSGFVLFCFVLFNLLGYIVSSHHCAIFIVQRSESAMCISYQSEWPSSRNLETTNAGEVVKKRERTLLHYWGECKLLQSL